MGLDLGVTLVVALLVTWALTRCPHKWEFVDKTVIPPALDALTKVGSVSSFSYNPFDLPKLLATKVIIVIRCDKCGGSQVLRESNTSSRV